MSERSENQPLKSEEVIEEALTILQPPKRPFTDKIYNFAENTIKGAKIGFMIGYSIADQATETFLLSPIYYVNELVKSGHNKTASAIAIGTTTLPVMMFMDSATRDPIEMAILSGVSYWAFESLISCGFRADLIRHNQNKNQPKK
ncbi:hypothetical protein A3F00_05575 [Candidatus Daviesbacteria bacterium RIFCSPHIGHO2_12_FULL_37_11]|uniref:Uncharacterized protein n=1 Tax=Candidatus Daviesbacteria bacterium RIFCSPHIGHO2_12_FULL_37_11 TaxID=1797777 RepID=A0A1F5K9L3_9BACT|nr:MAG: hypothetical protein A2769_03910 [Candidatus Daviesbacteria bacterium RIFCSPHIGHO2_01_FULL_37_27]OGE37321.1 MAG: hypothetical protein A3F00_05575 [Candidatus Daviesbacteria bacterium RIFCSPHIGHO2_12_FULL_37_11]OGE45327.1 MAG: hypothetical protein A3B39_01280 [Candidatus Daviesbacteria bacterium RIFCSPLOWO2_01_FULL_37_10]